MVDDSKRQRNIEDLVTQFQVPFSENPDLLEKLRKLAEIDLQDQVIPGLPPLSVGREHDLPANQSEYGGSKSGHE